MKIFIEHQSTTYKFLNIERADDGSIYIFVDRKPKEQRERYVKNPGDQAFKKGTPINKRRYLSYHTTGRVNYHGLINEKRNYFEPLTELTQPNFVLGISIPSAQLLDVYDKKPELKSTDFFIKQESSERFTMGIIFTPNNQVELDIPAVRFSYGDVALFLFPLELTVDAPTPKHFVYISPTTLFKNQRIGKHEAELAYVQGSGKNQMVVRGPNNKGEYTLFFGNVMRIPPKITVTLQNPKFNFVLLQNEHPHKMKFRIFGKGDLVREKDLRPIIKSIILDAEI